LFHYHIGCIGVWGVGKMKKVIVIGASSGIGKELAKIFSVNGYEVGITARRTDLLEELAAGLPTRIYTTTMDISLPELAMQSLETLIKEMGDVETIILCAGIGYINPQLDWQQEKATVDTNVSGFTALSGVIMRYFVQKQTGHLVGISSIAGVRGSHICPSYNASKAYISNYLEGLQKKAYKEKLNIKVTDIQPGLVDTAMAKGAGLFWVAPAPKAAKQIYRVIQQGKRKAYITKRWIGVAWLLKIMPEFLYNQI
jgi:short-subunit dehydrogenase